VYKRRGRDSLTAYLLPTPDCSNWLDYKEFQLRVNGVFREPTTSSPNANATKLPQSVLVRACWEGLME
jgi:hypothetical protein